MNSDLIPFIFARLTKESQEKIDCFGLPVIKDWVVKIAEHDLKIEDLSRIDDPELGKYCLVPSLDITIEDDHIFATFEEARNFVKEWWKNN